MSKEKEYEVITTAITPLVFKVKARNSKEALEKVRHGDYESYEYAHNHEEVEDDYYVDGPADDWEDEEDEQETV